MRPLVRRVPQLQRLAIFEAVATSGGFTAAARDLEISQPAVSRHMTALSRELGVTLFKRSGRTFVLTAHGRILADALATAFSTVEQALDQLVETREPFVFAVQPAMATSWVVPLLEQLEAAAETDIRLRIFDRASELDASDWDVAIVPGRAERPNWKVTLLFPEVVRPLASPALAAELGLDSESECTDLVGARLLHIDDVERPSMTWQQWFSEAGADIALPVPRVFYPTYPTVVQEALAGNGIVLGWQYLLSDLVDRGLLVPVGPSVERTDSGHHLCWTETRGDDRHRAILSLLQSEIAATNTLLS